MLIKKIENLNVYSEEAMMSPALLKERFPLSKKAINTVFTGQSTIKNILDRKDHRIFVVVGPCSVHDADAAKEYAAKLIQLAEEVRDALYLVMRVYFEKPRTNVGWQGLINDPYLDNTCKIDDGLSIARGLLLDIANLGLPTAGEALDLVSPQYIQDLFSWTAIGARTSESQTHRKMASGFSNAVGFKNGTNGSLKIAINAIRSAAHANHFLSVDPMGKVAIIRTRGNHYTHIVLRGGDEGSNYDEKSVEICEKALEAAGLKKNIMIDCSHANSMKDPENQLKALEDCTHQFLKGNRSIIGLMIESNLEWGNQPIPNDLGALKYGISVTDACIGWQTTERAIKDLYKRVKNILPVRI